MGKKNFFLNLLKSDLGFILRLSGARNSASFSDVSYFDLIIT